MKTHSTEEDCSPATNLPEDKQRCRPDFVCGECCACAYIYARDQRLMNVGN